MGIHFNHKSRAGDRKMQKELKLKMKAEERKKKREEQEKLKMEEEMRKLEELTRPDKEENKQWQKYLLKKIFNFNVLVMDSFQL